MYLFPFDEHDVVRTSIEANPRFKLIFGEAVSSTSSWAMHEREEELVEASAMQYGLSLSEGQYIIKSDNDLVNVPRGLTSTEYNGYLVGEVVPFSTGSIFAVPMMIRYFDDVEGCSDDRKYLYAIKNALNYNAFYSPHYQYSSSFGDKEAQEMCMVSLVEIFYGNRLMKGSVILKVWNSGSLVASMTDENQNGELIQTFGSGSGSVGGVVLYDEGVLLLTGSWSLNDAVTDDYDCPVGSDNPRWKYFGKGSETLYTLEWKGSTIVQNMLMYAHAPVGHLNYSSNPSYTKLDERNLPFSSSQEYREDDDMQLTNTIYSEHEEVYEDFRKQTFLSKIAILDEEKNVIAIATLAEPVRKIEDRAYVFKLSLDF